MLNPASVLVGVLAVVFSGYRGLGRRRGRLNFSYESVFS
jgi:hypothetical protein